MKLARPREFDEEAAVRVMTHAFWSRGYQATSTRDLEEATGLTTGSLYKAFGSKDKILSRCLDYYMDSQSYLAILRRNDAAPLREAFRAVLDAVIESVDPKRGRASGCLVTNLATELANADPALGREIAKRLRDMQNEIRKRLERAQDALEIERTSDAETLSSHLMTVLQGMLVIATTTRDRDGMRLTRDFTLSMLR